MSGPIAYLILKNANAAIDFYCAAFGAEVLERYVDSDGRIGHAELKIGSGRLMLADAYPEAGYVSLELSLEQPRSFQLYLPVSDVDAAFARAKAAGATVIKSPTDEVHGGRRCKLVDPYCVMWSLGA